MSTTNKFSKRLRSAVAALVAVPLALIGLGVPADDVAASLPVPPNPSSGYYGVSPSMPLTRLADNAYYQITQDGTVVDGIALRGCIVISASNVVIRNSLIECPGANAVVWVLSGTGTVITQSTLRGIDNGGSAAGVAGTDLTASRLDISGTIDGIVVGENSTVEDNAVYDLWEGITAGGYPAHNDGVQVSGGSDIVVSGNWISHRGVNSNAAVFVKPETSAPMSNIMIRRNFLAGFGFTVSCQYAVSGCDVVENTFVAGAARFGPISRWGGATGITSCNVWDTGEWLVENDGPCTAVTTTTATTEPTTTTTAPTTTTPTTTTPTTTTPPTTTTTDSTTTTAPTTTTTSTSPTTTAPTTTTTTAPTTTTAAPTTTTTAPTTTTTAPTTTTTTVPTTTTAPTIVRGVTRGATADATADIRRPTTAAGSATTLTASAEVTETFLSFPVASADATKRAVLRLSVAKTATANSVLAIGTTTTGWSEATLTWSTRPTVTSPSPVSTAIATSTSATTMSFDVTAAVRAAASSGATTISFTVRNTSGSGAVMSSREARISKLRPQLVVG